MINIEDLRNNPDKYINACKVKRVNFDILQFLKLDQEYRKAVLESENLRAEQNKLSKLLPSLDGVDKANTLDKLKYLASTVKELVNRTKSIEAEWQTQLLKIPSLPNSEVPMGADDSENVELYRVGEIKNFNFDIKDHVTLATLLNLLDIDRGVKVAGARNYFLKGLGARLQHAVMQFAIEFLSIRGYELMEPPHIVKHEIMAGTGYFPGGEEQAFHLDDRDTNSYLIGTSEVPVCAYHMDEILDEAELPKKFAGYSACYRREAGTYGKDAHGLYRVHQFYKVEQVIISKADENISNELHNELLKNSEDFVAALGIPYRVVAVCTGDLGQGQTFKHDIECWMPSRKSYGETHSCSSFKDFQARRLKIRYKTNNNNVYCYTLNNTLAASPRILIPLLENNQNSDGSITIPEVLRGYLGGIDRIG
jgi:seryl-tRNA synthetase